MKQCGLMDMNALFFLHIAHLAFQFDVGEHTPNIKYGFQSNHGLEIEQHGRNMHSEFLQFRLVMLVVQKRHIFVLRIAKRSFSCSDALTLNEPAILTMSLQH